MSFRRVIGLRVVEAALLPFALLTGAPTTSVAQERPASTRVSIQVGGTEKHAADMLAKLQRRGQRMGITVTSGEEPYQLRVLVLARGPQWQQVSGVAASGAAAVLAPDGKLLFMHLRQKESSAGGAMDALADEVLQRLPALLRGEVLLER